MPILSPKGANLPSDWRSAYDQYQILRKLAGKLGLSPAVWKLEYPSRTAKMFDPRWKMTYVDLHSKRLVTIYLGGTGSQAAATISKLIPAYKKAATPAIPVKARSVPTVDGKDARSVPGHVINMYERLKHFLTKNNLNAPTHPGIAWKGKASRWPWKQMHDQDPKLYEFMQLRAGYLPMSMADYLWHHPHGRLFPSPPLYEKELQRRQDALSQQADQKERNLREDNDYEREPSIQAPSSRNWRNNPPITPTVE